MKISENKNSIPFYDRERITNFQKYHEKITAIFQIRQRKIFRLEKGKYSNEKKENITNLRLEIEK